MKYYFWSKLEQAQIDAIEFEDLGALVEYLNDSKNFGWERVQQIVEPLASDGYFETKVTERRPVSDFASVASLMAGRSRPTKPHDVTWCFCDETRMEAAIQMHRERQRQIEEAKFAVEELVEKDRIASQ